MVAGGHAVMSEEWGFWAGKLPNPELGGAWGASRLPEHMGPQKGQQ